MTMGETMRKVILTAFLVSWTAHWSTMKTCEINEPKKNPYNDQVEYPTQVYAVACWDSNSLHMDRRFETIKEAQDFRKGCEAERAFGMITGVGNGTTCTDWEIKEIK